MLPLIAVHAAAAGQVSAIQRGPLRTVRRQA